MQLSILDLIALAIILIAATYAIIAWAKKAGAPKIIVAAAADIEKVEAKAEDVVADVEAELLKGLKAAIAKATDLTSAKAGVAAAEIQAEKLKADAAAELAKVQTRIAEVKAMTAAIVES